MSSSHDQLAAHGKLLALIASAKYGQTRQPQRDHDDDHGQDAAHRHSHSHAPASFGKAFAIGVALNTGFVVAEWLFGLAAHSLALLADAAHNLGDVMGLLLAWGAMHLSQRKPECALHLRAAQHFHPGRADQCDRPVADHRRPGMGGDPSIEPIRNRCKVRW